MSNKKDIFKEVRRIVSQMPSGKVATYGQIAKLAGIKDARIVGRALYGNKDSDIPCHRVVKKDGSLAVNYSAGDWEEDKRKLKSEGVEFISETKVDLEKYLWRKIVKIL